MDTRFQEGQGSQGSQGGKPSASRPKDDFTSTAQAISLEKVIHTK